MLAVLARPRLWPTAVVQVLVLAAPGWWRRWPPVPAPPPGYLRFRMQTAYGDPDAAAEPDDLVGYLEWCREWRSGRARHGVVRRPGPGRGRK